MEVLRSFRPVGIEPGVPACVRMQFLHKVEVGELLVQFQMYMYLHRLAQVARRGRLHDALPLQRPNMESGGRTLKPECTKQLYQLSHHTNKCLECS